MHHRNLVFFIVLGVIEFSFHQGGCEGTPTLYPAEPFDAMVDAALLRNALINRNESVFIDILTKRVSRQRGEIVEAYQTLHGESLTQNIRIFPLRKIIFENLLTTLPDYYAKKLHGSIFFNADPDCVMEILCTLSDSEIREMELSYRKLYKQSFKEHMGPTDIYDVCVANRNESQPIDHEKALSDAQILFQASKTGRGGDSFIKFLKDNNHQQIRETMLDYMNLFGHSFANAIFPKNVDGPYYNASSLIATIYCISHPSLYYTWRLIDGMGGLETDNDSVGEIIITRSERDLGEIKKIFPQYSMIEQSLEAQLTKRLIDSYKDVLIPIVRGQRHYR